MALLVLPVDMGAAALQGGRPRTADCPNGRAAFVVSIVAAVVSIGAIVTSVVLWGRSGPRVTCKFETAVLVGGGTPGASATSA